MPGGGQMQKGLLILAAGVCGLTLVAGILQSVRTENRLPSVDLFVNGSTRSIDRLLAQDKLDGALRQLEMQSRLLPQDAATCEQLGALWGRLSRPQEARVQFEKLVQLRPDYAVGYNFLGCTYLETGELKLAIPCFVKAVDLDPEFAFAFNNLGKATAQSGQLQRAELFFAKALELMPDYREAQTNLNWTLQQLKSPQGPANQ